MTKRTRQYLGILAAIAAYYLVHEGAHFLCAILMGTFKSVHFMGIGMQIEIYSEQMSAWQKVQLLLMKAGKSILKKAFGKITTSPRNTMRIWGTASIRSTSKLMAR